LIDKEELWVVSELFYPDETSTGHIMTELAVGLSQLFNVKVFSGPPSYNKSKYQTNERLEYNETYQGLKIERVRSINLDKNKMFQRLFRLCWISFFLSIKVLKNIPKNSKVLLVTNPAPLLLLFSIIARIKSLKLFLIVHDVYPNNLVAAGVLNPRGLATRFLEWMFNKSYNACEKLIVLGRDMKDILAVKTRTSIQVIPNWAQVGIIRPNPRRTDKLKFVFAGNIGRVQGIDILCKVAEKLNASKSIEFIFAGGGAMLPYLEKFISEHQLTNVKIRGAYKRREQSKILNLGNIGIVSLSDNMLGLGVPSKTYNLLAAGKPLLYIGNRSSEIATLIFEKNIGWYADINSIDSIVETINIIVNCSISEMEEIGLRCRKLAEEEYTKEKIIETYINCLTQ